MRGLARPLLLGVFVSLIASAQSDVGAITGYVRDQTGATVPNAHVVIRNEGTGDEHPAAVDSSGRFSVPDLRPGEYELIADAPGFKKFDSTHNKLDAASTLELDANLQLGSVSETVEVSATASLLQTESGSVASQVTGRQIQDEELNGRNPLYSAQMLPGVRSGSTLGDFNFAVGGGVPYQINGARTQDTLVTFDGAPAVRTRGNGAVVGVASVDATEEIHVLTADYQAQYGDASGGQVRIVTKSGTTDFHGSMYEYFRNSALDANTWSRNLSKSTNFASPFRYNNFGFTAGGPIWVEGLPKWMRQKMFWFVNEDWTRYRFTDTQQQAVPTALMRTGNFSELLNPSNPWYKGGRQLYYPGTCPKLNAPSCVPIPGNIIPANLLSPNGIAILNAYPAPTPGFIAGTQNWIAQAGHPINQRKGVLNGDFLLSEKQRLSFRRTDASYWEYQPFDQGSGLTPKYFIRPNQTNTLEWTYTISPTLLNQAMATVSLDDVYIPVNTAAPGFNRQSLSMPITYPFLFGGKDLPGKIPTVNIPNFYGLSGGPYPSHSSGPIYTASDTLTKVLRNHTITAGITFQYLGENDEDQINVATVPGGASNQNGTFSFTDTGVGSTSGVGIANLALGVADSYTEIGPRAYTLWRGQVYEPFIQDSWQITPKLHIDYGVRETTTIPFYALWGNADYFDGKLYNPAQAVQVDPKTGNVILGTGNPYNGVVDPGFSKFPSAANGRVLAASQPVCDGSPCTGLFDPNLSKSYVAKTNQFQPRLGIAYQISNKTVVRSGIGRFTTRMGLLDNIFPGGNSPFQPFVTVTNVSVDNPGASLKTGVAAPLTMTTLNPNLKPPEAWDWNFTVEQQLFWNSVLNVSYVGRRGLHGWQVYDINQPFPGSVQANPGVATNALRPYRGFAAIQEEESVVNSMYNALQVSWNRNFLNGVGFGVSYTLSKSMDNGSNYRDIVPFTYNTSNLWGPSEYDTRNIFIANWVYVLPIFKRQNTLAGKIAGGWEITGSAQLQSGTPCGVGSNNDYAGVGEFGSFGCGTEGQFWLMNGTPNIIGAFAGPTGNASSPKYFNTSVFASPTPGNFNLQSGVRDSIYGPGFVNWDAAMFKNFVLSERFNVEFRAEAYNFPNHPNLTGPNYNPTQGTFGEITQKATSNPRQLQLSLRLAF